MGEAQTPHFYDFGIFEPVTKPQNQHHLSLETPGHLTKTKKQLWNILQKHTILSNPVIMFLKIWEIVCTQLIEFSKFRNLTF